MGWTHQCWSCCHESVWGCFMPGSGCHCDLAEGACKRDFPAATWSNKCHECNNIDPTSDEASEKKDDDGNSMVLLAVVISTSALACSCLLAVSVGLMFSMKTKQHKNDTMAM